MAESYNGYGNFVEAARGRQQYSDAALDSGNAQSLPPTTEGLSIAHSILGSGAGYSQGNGSAYAGALQTMQGAYGNRALQRYMGQPQGQGMGGMAGYVGGMAGGQGTSTISLTEKPWVMPGQPTGGGTQLPPGTDGGFGYWNDNPSKVIIPGLPFGIPLHDIDAGFGIGVGGTNILAGSGDIGSWDTQGGGTRYGARGSIGLLPGMQLGPIDGALLSATGEASIGNDGFTLAGGLTAGGVAATVSDNFSKESNIDQSIHAGISEGPSLGLRGYWGDSDDDSYREYGFGFDLGAFSVDVKSEDPLRYLMTGLNPINMLPDPINPFTQNLPKYNMTEATLNKAYDMGESILDMGNSAMDWMFPPSPGLEPTDGAPSAQSASAGGLGSLLGW